MKQLEIKISSREVAEMMQIQHKDLLKKIDGINKDFDSEKVRHEKYWIEGTFENRGKQYREFQVTKRGCEFLAHKTTGTNGNLFTDRYMDRFENMVEIMSNNDLAPKVLDIDINKIISNALENQLKEVKEYYKIQTKTRTYFTTYIKNQLGINKTNEEYNAVKIRMFLVLGVTKWEEIEIGRTKEVLNAIDEAITIIKANRPKQFSLWD